MSWDQLDAALKSAHLRAVARHWNEARGNAPLPCWTDLRPARMAKDLPFLWVYGYDRASDTFIGRLAGSRVEAVFNRGFRGTAMEDLYPEPDYARLFHCAKRVLDHGEGYRGEGRIYARDYHFVFGERLILPLAADSKFAGSILGCSDTSAVDAPEEPEVKNLDAWFSLTSA